MLRPTDDCARELIETIAREIIVLLRTNSRVRRAVAATEGGDEGWRQLVGPVWERVLAAGVDFCALDEEQRSLYLKRQIRWAAQDVLRRGCAGEPPVLPQNQRDPDGADALADPAPPEEIRRIESEERRHLEDLVREAWLAMPSFERAILALYAGRPCEADATATLAKRTGLTIAELIARTRRRGVLEVRGEALAGQRGGRRGRQGALAEALGVSRACMHQWTCRARNLFVRELRGRCPDTTAIPSILARVLQ